MNKILLGLFLIIITVGFKVPGNDYKEDASTIMREIDNLSIDKQDRDRPIYTSAPGTADGRVSEERIVNLPSGSTYYYIYKKVGTSQWKRVLMTD